MIRLMFSETDPVAGALTSLVSPVGRSVFGRSQELFHSGQRIESLFRIVAGRVRLERCLADGRVVVVDTVRSGEMVTEAALFSEQYHCDGVAEVRTTVEIYDKRDVLNRLSSDPRALVELCRSLAQKLRASRRLLELHNVRPARERLLRFLDRSRDGGAPGNPTENRPVRMIAHELGLATETVYRLLAELEKDGLIWRDGRAIGLRANERT